MKDELRINDWWTILDSDFINDYNNFTKILYAVLDNDTPLTKTNEAIGLKNKKARLWKRYITTKNQYDRGMYTRTNNERCMTRRLRIDFEQNIAMNVKEKPKHFWKYVKSRIKNKQSIPTLEKPDGSKAITPKEKANSLNQFFCSVFTREIE